MEQIKRLIAWYRGENDIEKEPPRGGIRRILYILVNYPGRLAAVNVLFLLCCVPVVTIPAALSALNCYLGKIFRIGYGMDLSDFGKEFRQGIRRYVPLGLANGALLFYAYYLLSLSGNYPQGGQREMAAGLGLGIAIAAVLLGSYSFVLSAMLDLSCRHILQNAAILILLEWKRSLILAAESALFFGAAFALAPYSVFWLLLCGFSVHQLAVCAIISPAVMKRIVEPYERCSGTL